MKTTRQKKVNLIFCGMVACGIFATGLQSARADSAESFDYADGALAGLNGGTGWSGAWYNDTSYNATITAKGGLLDFDSRDELAATSDIWRDLAAPISSRTVYLSVRMQNLNGGGRYMGVKAFSASGQLFGQGSARTHWTIDKVVNGTNTLVESSVLTTEESLLVLKVEFDASAGGVNEMVTFWVNPNESIPVSQLDVADSVGGQSYESTEDYGSMTRLRVLSGGYSSNYTPGFTDFTVDDIQIIHEPLEPIFVGDVAISLLPGTNALTLTWATSSDTYNYTVEKKTNLVDATWAPSLTGIPGNNGNVTVTTAVDQAESFYRVIGE